MEEEQKREYRKDDDKIMDTVNNLFSLEEKVFLTNNILSMRDRTLGSYSSPTVEEDDNGTKESDYSLQACAELAV